MSINVEWTIDDVAARFVEAAKTARRLPPDRSPGYASAWPALQRMAIDLGIQSGEDRKLRTPPSSAAVVRMLETNRWVQWLDQDLRHLVWMRADRRDWQEICRRFGCDRTTAWRRWKKALQIVADQLTDDYK
uniref:Putative RNA polymerase sigma factor n=1 Tax=Candidatus Nitrotoga fabula TaxID=2182327 RepID=A0A2X0R880_9PROT|nr:putative RNA polymerase sigma factor [Candidatus Nitrotoga fabula]